MDPRWLPKSSFSNMGLFLKCRFFNRSQVRWPLTNFRIEGSQRIMWNFGLYFLPAVRGIKPWTAGCEAPTLPLCYAVPSLGKLSVVVMSFRKIVTEPTIVLHSRTIFPLSEPFPPEGRNVRFVLNIFPAFIKKLILFGFRKVFCSKVESPFILF